MIIENDIILEKYNILRNKTTTNKNKKNFKVSKIHYEYLKLKK